MNKIYTTIFVVFLLLTIAAVIAVNSSVQFGYSRDRDKKLEGVDDSIVSMGDYIRYNRQQFLSAIDYKADASKKEIAFWVNDLPVTCDEINFRLAMSIASGSGSQTMPEIRKVFVEYRVIEKEARELNLMPTDEEIEEYISTKMTDSLSIDIMERVMEAWGITEKEYWDVARYDSYYYLMCEKLERYYFRDFYAETMTFEDSQKIKTMWDELISEKTSKASLR